MREILFRGQTRKLGEKVRVGDGAPIPGHWVYGGILQGNGSQSIIYAVNADGRFDDKYPVHSDTVSQYTGLEDRNGKKIFEGDIVRQETDYINRVVFFADADGRGWYTECERYGTEALYEYERVDASHKPVIYFDGVVIGNIWDNPELIEVSEDG